MNKGIKRIIFSVIFFAFVISGFALTSSNAKAANCEWQSGGCNAAENYIYDPGQDDCAGTKLSDSYICCCKGSSSGSDGEVVIGTEGGDFLTDVLGKDNIVLKIFKPMNYWEGQAGVWAIGAYVFSIGFTLLFIAFVVAILIGVIKWQSSQGAEDQVRAAQKWIKNALIGFISTIVVFAGVNIVTWWLGIGNVFNLAENLVTCEDVVLYEYKDENSFLNGNYDCSCVEGAGWNCVPSGE